MQPTQTIQYTTDTGYSVSPGSAIIAIALTALLVVGLWKMFEKADEAGWKALIPFYNTYTLFRMAGSTGWGFLLMFIPFVNIVVSIVIALDLAKRYGKSGLFGFFGLFLFPFVGYLMLGFGDAKYVGPKHD